MNEVSFAETRNCAPVPLDRIPCVGGEAFSGAVVSAIKNGRRLCSLFGAGIPSTGNAAGAFSDARIPSGDAGTLVFAVLANDSDGTLSIVSSRPGTSYPSIAATCPQAQLFERELFEQWNVEPSGHPWLKPVRFKKGLQRSARADSGPVSAHLESDGDQTCGRHGLLST